MISRFLLAALGLGTVVGAMGQLFGDINLESPDMDPQQLITTLRDSSWQTLLALGLTAAAATLGAPPHVAFRRVLLPLIAPGVATGA